MGVPRGEGHHRLDIRKQRAAICFVSQPRIGAQALGAVGDPPFTQVCAIINDVGVLLDHLERIESSFADTIRAEVARGFGTCPQPRSHQWSAIAKDGCVPR